MKIKRILAAVLSVLMLSTMFVFTASAETTPVYVMKAHNGDGFSGEAVTGTKTYDAENDVVYYHYVPKDSADWMHFGWHGATGAFTWSAPMTVGMIVRTNKEGGVPSIRLCDRSDNANKLTINKKADALKGDGTWEVVWFPAVTQADMDNVANETVKFDGLTHVQCFAIGENLVGNQHLDSDVYFDVAGYAFFNDTLENLADVDLYEAIGTGAPEITLSFDAQNGTEVTTKTVKSGAYVTANIEFPAEPTAPEGKVFAGWATDKNAATGALEVAVPAEGTTYYAIWAQDESIPGDVTLASLKIKGTNAALLGSVDLTADPIVVNVPHNWKGDLATGLEVVTTDATATVNVEAGTFGEGSTVTVKNGSANATYNIEYKQAAAGSKSYTPTGAVTSNPNPSSAPYKGATYTINGTRFTSPARVAKDSVIDGQSGTKITYNTKEELVPANGAKVDDEAKTITGNASYYTIASDASPSFEGGGAYGFVTLSDYPWARVKYYLDAGEDGKTVERAFAMGSTNWNNDAAKKGYAESTKKNTAVASASPMVTGRWAYAYIDLASQFAEDYGFTYQFHFRPFNGNNFAAKNVMEVSADDATVAVPHSTNGHAILFDDAFYLASVELFNEFPGTEDGKFEQIAPYEGLFTATAETEYGANDGKIEGLAVGMEYKLKSAETWTAVEEAEVAAEATGLVPGTYEIRYAAYGDFAASPATEVTINSALAAKPEVTVVNATKVGANDGKITGVDSAMSYRAEGATDWTAVAADATEITDLVPGVYEFIYLADGEIRTEDSEISKVIVLVDFPDADNVFYVTNNEANSDATVYDGSSYEKAYFINQGKLISAALGMYLEKDKTTVMVVVDGITLGGWNENVGRGNGAHLIITGLKPESYMDFACHNASGNNFSMQNFGNVASLTIENITLQKTCVTGEGLAGECGITVSAMTDLIIGEGVIAGENADKIRIYSNNNAEISGSYLLESGTFENVYAGVTYTNITVSQGDMTITLDGANVGMISATRHQRAWLGDFNVIVNSGTVRNELYAGTMPGAFGGDAYVEINGGTVGKLYTTALGREDAWNSNGNKYFTGSGIAAGSSIVVVNGGEVKAFANGAAAPGGSALIIGKDAVVPELTGAEADYVITIDDTSALEPVFEEGDYNYESKTVVIKSGETDRTTTKDADIAFKANTLKGFKVTIPEGYNTVMVNGNAIELTDGVIALEDLGDVVNKITFAATWTLKADMNGGAYGLANAELDDFFANGMKIESDELEAEGGIPGADDIIKPYRSGYTLAGWALTAEATPEECVTFPYMMTGDTTLYAIWVEANDTPLTADEDYLNSKEYYVYTTDAEDVYEDFVPSMRADLGEVEYYGAYSVKVMDASTGEEDKDAHFSVKIDLSDVDLEGKLLYVENAEAGGKFGLEAAEEGKYVIADVASGAILQIYTFDPIALYTLDGTYYAKRNEYIVDIYLDSPAVNAGSVGLGFACMDYVEAVAADGVQFIEITDAEAVNNEGFILITWGVEDTTAAIGGDGKVHIATLNFTMTPEQREWFVMLSNSIGAAGMDKTDEVYDGEYYLVAEHKVNDLAVKYTPAIIADINDTVGPDDMVTVKGTVVMTAREDGTAPIASNYATLYWRHKGANTWNNVVIEDADTDTSVVEYTLSDVPADTEIEVYVEKNGYLTGKATFTFEAKTEEETEEKPERTADAIELVAGDIKGNADDACGDGKINIADFVRVLRGFDEDVTAEYVTYVDINEDGEANVTDLGFVKANFGKVSE